MAVQWQRPWLRFKFDGETYVLGQAALDVLPEAVRYQQDRHYLAAARTLLGPEQWSKLTKKRRTGKDIEALWLTMSAAVPKDRR